MIERCIISGGELKFESINQTKKGVFRKKNHRTYLTQAQIREIRNIYADHFNWQLAEMFNCSETTILNIRRKFGLKKSDKILNNTRFKNGQISYNKGKHYKFKNSGQFEKGHIPKNHKSIGSIRKNVYGYIEIKITEPDKWKLLHRKIYEENFGAIPRGYIIVFKDGNTLNCTIENLEMISRSENMIRNQNREKASKSLARTWRSEKLRQKYGLPRKTKFRIKV